MGVTQQSRHFLMDPRLVEAKQNVQLVVNSPRKAEAVLTQEMPWESYFIHPHSLVRNKEEYLLYYQVYINNDGKNRTETCLATSRDGINWDRPELGQVEYAGSKKNNILASGGTVSIDPTAVPTKRFLMTGRDARRKPGDSGYVLDSIALFTSPDGRTWTQITDPLTPFTHDSTNQVFYDDLKRKYVAYVRSYSPELGRAIAYYEAEDIFEPWPIKPSPTNKPSSYTTPYGSLEHYYVVNELPIAISWKRMLEPYNPNVTSVGNMYIAFPDIFRIFPGPDHPEEKRFPKSELYAWSNDGLVAPMLFISKDGVSFTRVGERPYIDLGSGCDLDIRQVRMVNGAIENKNEISQYYGAQRSGHTLARGKRKREAGSVVRVIQRKDGYAGYIAGHEEGEIITAPIECTGRRLEINCNAGALGSVSVEIMGAKSGTLPGYGFGDSAILFANCVYEPVQWAEGRTLKPIIGKKVRLKFRLARSTLFSFKFSNDNTKARGCEPSIDIQKTRQKRRRISSSR